MRRGKRDRIKAESPYAPPSGPPSDTVSPDVTSSNVVPKEEPSIDRTETTAATIQPQSTTTKAVEREQTKATVKPYGEHPIQQTKALYNKKIP